MTINSHFLFKLSLFYVFLLLLDSGRQFLHSRIHEGKVSISNVFLSPTPSSKCKCINIQRVTFTAVWGSGKGEGKGKKFPGCPSLSYQSIICARRPPSSAVILRQHPGPQDTAGNTAGHQERCDSVTGYSRHTTLNTHVHGTHKATQ